MFFNVIAAVVGMKNLLNFVVIYSRHSHRGFLCVRAVDPQNHLSPAQKEKKKRCIDTAWVHSMKLVLHQPVMPKWIPVQGSQV